MSTEFHPHRAAWAVCVAIFPFTWSAAQTAPPQILAQPTATSTSASPAAAAAPAPARTHLGKSGQAPTLGDLADAQEARLREEFLRAHGGASDRGAAPAQPQVQPPTPRAMADRSSVSLRPTAIWGTPGHLRAEVAVDGRTQPVVLGDTMRPGWVVTGIRPDGVEFEARTGNARRPGTRRWVGLGETLWISPQERRWNDAKR